MSQAAVCHRTSLEDLDPGGSEPTAAGGPQTPDRP